VAWKPLAAESRSHHALQLGIIEGLVEDRKGNGKLGFQEPAGDDDLFVLAVLLEEADPVVAPQDVHAVVGDDELHRVVQELLDGPHAVGSHDDRVPLVLEVVPQGEPDRVLVFDDENAGLLAVFHVPPGSALRRTLPLGRQSCYDALSG
jgi:hypothetical protein